MDKIIVEREKLGESAFYSYDEARIYDNIALFKSIPYAHTSIHFASMANDNPHLLKILRDHDIGLFVNSRKHIQLGLSCGFDTDRIIFSSTGISEPTMALIIEKGIHLNIDSQDQLKLYGRLNPGGAVGIRLNIDEKSKNNIFIGMESRIGILESELESIFEIAERYRIKLVGSHVYLGTDVTSLEDLLAGVDRTLQLSDYFTDLEYVDLGGGFPIERGRFDFDTYKLEITRRMEDYSARRGRDIKLILEPGRAMFGNTASFFAQITDVKERPDRYLICCNASASLIPRAMFYEDYNAVKPYQCQSDALFDKPVDVVGNTTYSRDFMSKQIHLPRVRVGDWLQFDHAGSYCYSMITRFLGQALPPEYLVCSDGHIETIRGGESFLEN